MSKNKLIDTESENKDLVLVGVSDFPTYETNPFLDGLVFQTRNAMVAIGKEQYVCENIETEDKSSLRLAMFQEVDKAEFVKLYKGNIKTLFELKNTGLKVFGYFMECLKISDDKVLFDVNECIDYTGYRNSKSVYQGLAELLSKQFIAKTNKKNVYFINLGIFFNGKRMTIVNHYVERKSHSMETNKIKNGKKITILKNGSPKEVYGNS